MPLQKPPYNLCIINKRHPHAQNLTNAFFINKNSGETLYNRVNKDKNISLNNMTWTSGGISNTGNSQYGLFNNTGTTFIDAEKGTIIFGFKSFIPGASGKSRTFLGNFSGVLGDFCLYFNSTGILTFMMVDGSFRYIRLNLSSLPDITENLTIAIVWNRLENIYDSKKLAFNINGSFYTPDSESGSTAYNYYTVNSNITIMNNYVDLTQFLDGEMQFLYFYNTNLSMLTLKSIDENPYAMVYSNLFLEEDDFFL